MKMKMETVGMLGSGQADWEHQMVGVDAVVGVVANGAELADLESWEACMESLDMSFEAY